jgi:hypothetical protein
VTEVDGFPAAFRAAERFIAHAEEQWLTQPRRPSWSPPPGRSGARPATRRARHTPMAPVPPPDASPATAPEPQTMGDAAAPTAPAPGPHRAAATGPATQLPLFDGC